MDDAPSGLAVYVHWPYCARICPYCDFNVYRQRRDEGLLPAILADLAYWRNWSGPRRITSLHFGGGTPSLMRPDDISAIVDSVTSLWSASSGMEIAIEANPNDAKPKTWAALRAAGVTRLSLGAQTFHNPALKLLGREHDADQARAALDLAISTFDQVSLDLIFGWTGQTRALWAKDLEAAIDSGAGHISAYQLTIEPGTAFERAQRRGEFKAVNSDQSAGLYDQTIAALTGAGFEHYEVSNYARPGARSRHNLAYWIGQDYVGAGPGAHGRLTLEGQRFATIAAMRPDDYQTRTAQSGHGIAEIETLSARDWAEEYVLMGLRIKEGISLARFHALSGYPMPEKKMQPLIEDGYLEIKEGRLCAAPKGRPVLNYLTEQLLT